LYEYVVHDDASSDMRTVIQKDRAVGFKIVLAVNALRESQDSMDRIIQSDWGGSPRWPSPKTAFFNTGPWVEAQNGNMNLWRLRFFDEDILGYRFIHAFFPSQNRYVLLAVVEKAEFGVIHDERFNYELEHPTSQRIASAYRALVDQYW